MIITRIWLAASLALHVACIALLAQPPAAPDRYCGCVCECEDDDDDDDDWGDEAPLPPAARDA